MTKRVPHTDAAPATGACKAMNPGTATEEMRGQLRNGWLGSIALHGLVLLSLFPLFRLSVPSISQTSFQWDVTLIQSTGTGDEAVQQLKTVDSAVASPPNQVPMPTHTIRRAPRSAERIVPVEPQAADQVVPPPQPSIASSAVLPKELVPASISDRPTPNQPPVSAPPQQQVDTAATSTTAESSINQTAAATVSDGTVGKMEPAQPAVPAATKSDREATPFTRYDYGWLQQAIFTQLEELKRSSHPFIDQSQPLRVMVKAVVSREGMLLDSSVAKSSGLARIDEEAIALVQRVFPMQFAQTLDREQIVMRIPITYSRE